MSNVTEQSTQLSPLKRAFLAIEELQARLEATEHARREPIALVGLGLRFPGASTPEALWQLLCAGTDAIGAIPPERWDVEAYFDPDPGAPGKMTQREGGFLREVDRFDPQFFGLAPREAAAMDPQQRLLLEVTWEALERAGLAPSRMMGSPTGVFVALTTGDYRSVHLAARGLDGLDAYFASGVADSIASGRISYVLGLQGPSLTVDTACSSSLVAVHLAVQSLRVGECRTAIAGAANLILSPENSITLSKYQMLAPDARCKFGDARADGFVRGEGVAALVLKRLSDALADGDPVLAVIRGSAANQDGASSGLTAPNGPAQEAVIRAALADARLAPAEVSYVEAHGTGTSLGDPIELQALGAVFGPARPETRPLVVGSIKTNIGHLEATAGMAGLIKLVLMLRHRHIPASLHFVTPSPHVAWDELPLRVPTALEPWPTAAPLVAGVSSFGFSGTNVHLVLEAAPAREPALPVSPQPEAKERPVHLLALAAKSASALRSLATSYAATLSAADAPPLADAAWTANSGRSHFAHRLAVVAEHSAAAAAALEAYARGEVAAGLVARHAERTDPPRVAFLFTGQGSQYAGMSRGLYQTQPVFRAALDRCAAILARHLDRPLHEILFAEPGSAAAQLLDQTTFTQPVLVALEVALAELWRSWGVEPAALLGHSVGEYAAAIVAGVLSLEDGLALVATRGRLMGALPAGGAMAAIFAPASTVEAAVAAHGGGVVVAAYNGPEHLVIAGPEAAVVTLIERFTAAGVRAQRLNVSHAFHSALLEPMLAELEQAAASVTLNPPRLRLLSNLSGGAVGNEITTPAYWRRHAREPVRFAEGVEQLARLGCDIFLEIGPHPTLLSIAQTVLPPDTGTWLPSLRKGRDDWQVLLASLADAYTSGATIDWVGFDRAYARHKLSLPTYPFERERYWVAPRRGALKYGFHEREHRSARRSDDHPLLGRRLRSALRQIQFEQVLASGDLAYFDEHRVFTTTILPAAAFVELALAAARAALQATLPALDDVVIHAPLGMEADGPRIVQTVVTPDGTGATIEILSQGENEQAWSLHATVTALPRPVGSLFDGALETGADQATLVAARERCPDEVAPATHYAALAAHGLSLGPSLQAVRQIWRGNGEAVGALALPEGELPDAGRYLLHPALLDACLQLLAIALPENEATYLPIALDHLRIYGPTGARAVAHARLLPSEGGAGRRETLAGMVRLFNEDGTLLAELDGLRLKRAEAVSLHRSGYGTPDDWLYEVAWQPLAVTATLAPAATLLAAPAVVATAAVARLGLLDAELNLAHYSALTPALEALAGDYIVRALMACGWQPAPGERFTTAALARMLGVAAPYHELLGRFLTILAEEGLLRSADGGWEVVAVPQVSDTQGRAETLVARFPAARGDIEMTRRCGEALADALRGAVDPLQLLFPGGSLATAEQLYRESPLARAYTSLLAEAVAAAVAAVPTGRTLRVLEIGAGTGGATSAVLPRLDPAHTSYCFTDISPLFLARARETFAAYPFVDYQMLDIEADPLAQGFVAGSFDLVIAANVIHATADLQRSLANLRRLLAPSGVVLLLEMTAPLRWIDISFGLTSGWWKFADRALRPAYPLLSREGWLSLLRGVGLEAPEALPGPDSAVPPGLEYQHILVARGPQQTLAASADCPDLLIFADEGGVGAALASLVRAGGGRATLLYRRALLARQSAEHDHAASGLPDELAQLLHESSGPDQDSWDGMVYLWPLDAPAFAEGSANLVADQQALLGGALHLAQAMLREGVNSRLWLATRGGTPAGATAVEPMQAMLWGFGKTLALEHPELRVVCVDLDPAPDVDAAAALFDEVLRGEEPQVARRGARRLAARLGRATIGATIVDAQPVELVITERGTLDNLVLRPMTRRTPGPGEVEIRVAATGLNFKDVLNLLGMYPGDPGQPGSECAGTVVAVGSGVTGLHPGDEVVALASGSFRSYVTVDAKLVALRPPSLSAEAALTIPIAYVTAAFALQHLGGMQAGERVLIHAAAGGVGMAAVYLARRAGAEVFATAGSPAKRDYVRSLGVTHVFDSRSLDFADGVRAATGGEGVDLVLNSLAGDVVPRSLELLRAGGRFLELGKRDHLTASQVAGLDRQIAYHVIDWGDEARSDPALIRRLLLDVLDSVGRGELPPLPLRVFPLEEAAAAFRFMAQARHIGKVIVTHANTGVAAAISADATYLITGGLSGLGLLTARWLAERGARHLALMGRRAAGDEALATLAELAHMGTQVMTVSGDVAQAGDVAGALARIEAEMPPLRGIIHAAGVLDDGAVTQQTWPRFRHTLAPKVDGAMHLHAQTVGKHLDFFVLYSSAAALLGSPGQSNHAAANSYLDALAHRRRADGLPALSINWGAWSEVGAAVSTGTVERIGTHGLGAIAPAQGLALLGRMLEAAPPQVGVTPINWPIFLERFGGNPSPFLREFITTSRAQAPTATPERTSTDPELVRQLAEAAPHRRLDLLRNFVRETTGRVLGLAAARIDDERPLSALGLDSLMAVELRNLLGAGLGLPRRLPATLVFDYPTVAAMTTYLASEALPATPSTADEEHPTHVSAPTSDTDVTTMLDALEDLSDEEIDRLLAEKLRD
ncbi:type I polyketide synthase [Candidatus Chloroploca sp. Khr17]|uniref:type I polyketide synthase n=1 Tax=Candidatus Chloroploca sp. Khr17 TaxID=2496869 RepID=UPI00101BB487|nr:type I polyketide synthase [Candidatus Chloroploca sp. Khr17]